MRNAILNRSAPLSIGPLSGTAASVHVSESSATEWLANHSLQQLQDALGLASCLLPTWILRGVFGQKIAAVAERMIDYDADVARRGFTTASRDLLPRVVPAVVVQGVTQIPIRGPLLIVSNHPGLYDAIALSACLPRGDVRFVAKDQPYWHALVNLSRYLITLRQESRISGTEMKTAIRHLAEGRCLILFPGGKIEPDPAQVEGAEACLDHWSRSPEWFAGKLEELTILPAAVGGVLSAHALGHPLSWLRWSVGNRRWLSCHAAIPAAVKRRRDAPGQLWRTDSIHSERWSSGKKATPSAYSIVHASAAQAGWCKSIDLFAAAFPIRKVDAKGHPPSEDHRLRDTGWDYGAATRGCCKISLSLGRGQAEGLYGSSDSAPHPIFSRDRGVREGEPMCSTRDVLIACRIRATDPDRHPAKPAGPLAARCRLGRTP